MSDYLAAVAADLGREPPIPCDGGAPSAAARCGGEVGEEAEEDMLMSFRREAKETAQVGLLVWIGGAFAIVFLVVVVLALNGVHLVTLPFVRQQETIINRSSQGYVEAKQAQLVKLTQDATRLRSEIEQGRSRGEDVRSREAQLSVTLDQIEQDAATLDPANVPPPTRSLMAAYGRFI